MTNVLPLSKNVLSNTCIFAVVLVIKNALILGLETQEKDENFRNFVGIHISKLHVSKYFIFFLMNEKLTPRFSLKTTALFYRQNAFPLSSLDIKTPQKHHCSMLYSMKNE